MTFTTVLQILAFALFVGILFYLMYQSLDTSCDTSQEKTENTSYKETSSECQCQCCETETQVCPCSSVKTTSQQ